jgi:HlyD family secretion protein
MREADSATVKREQKLTKEKSQGSKANSQSPTHIQMKRILKITLFIAITGIFGWTIWFLYQKSEEKPVLFQTQLPEVTDIVKKTVATGAVVPRKEVNIKPRVSGIIEQLYVIAGDKVKKGDMIARIKIIPNMVNLNEAENRLNRAKLTLDNAKMDYDRNKKLYESRMIAMSEFQSYLLSFNTAKAELETAENNLQLIKEGISKSSGSVSNTIVRSTIEGMVLDVPLKEGSSVIESNTFNEGTTIAVVADLGEMIFEGKVDESEVGKIKPGMDLILTIGAIEAEKFDAELEYIVLDRKDSVLSLSESLLQFENEDKPYVEVETAPQTFEKRYVKLGLSDGIRIEVLDGVKKTDKIKDPNSNNKTEEIPGGEG